MAHRAYTNTPDGIEVRTRYTVQNILVACTLLAVFCLMVGASFVRYEQLQSDGVVLLLSGIIIAVVPQLLVRRVGRQQIGRLSFRATSPVVVVSSGVGRSAEIAELSVADIRELQLVVSDSNSTADPEYRFYDVVCRLHEGTQMLVLDNLYSRKHAEEVLREFDQVLRSARETLERTGDSGRCLLPQWIDVDDHASRIHVQWTAGGSVIDSVPLLGLFALFFVLAYLFRDKLPGDGLFHIVVWSVIALAAIMMVVLLLVARAATKRRFALDMDAATLRVHRDAENATGTSLREQAMSDIVMFGAAPYRIGTMLSLFALPSSAIAAADTLHDSSDSDLISTSINEVQLLSTLTRFDLRSRSAAELIALRAVLNYCLHSLRSDTRLLWKKVANRVSDQAAGQEADTMMTTGASPRLPFITSYMELHPHVFGWCAVLAIVMPLSALFLSLRLISLPGTFVSELRWLFVVMNGAHIVLAVLIAAVAYREKSLRLLSLTVLLVTVGYVLALVGPLNQFSLSGSLLFAHTVAMLILAVQLLRTKEWSVGAGTS